MIGNFPVLRFLRDSEATLREMAQASPIHISSGLLRLANDTAIQAARLLDEMVEAGLLPGALTVREDEETCATALR